MKHLVLMGDKVNEMLERQMLFWGGG